MSVISNCPSCKASPKFVQQVKEPGSDRVVIFCGKCHKVLPSTPHEPVDGLEHLNSFAVNMTNMLMALSGMEVMSAAFFEGVKSGVNMALSVPWSEKEKFWMEKYGVAKKERVKGLKKMIADLEQLEKTADATSNQNNRSQLLETYKADLRKLENQENDGISN